MQRVIMTGGNGFIGSHLAANLVASGVEVHAIANENQQRLASLLPPRQIHVLGASPYEAADLVCRLQPDTIFHLAAVYAEPQTIDCIAGMVEGNLALGTALLFGASRCDRPAAFINTGTFWQFSETGAYAPNTVYAATKQAFQDILFFYEQKRFVSAVTLILYDTFGAGDTRAKLWASLLRQSPGASVPLSEGHQLLELVAIDDVVRAFTHAAHLLAAGHPLDPIYAIRSGRSVTLKQMVLDLNRRADLNLDLQWGANPYWEGQVFTPWQGPMLPGWAPEVDVLEEMLRLAALHRPQPEIPEVVPG